MPEMLDSTGDSSLTEQNAQFTQEDGADNRLVWRENLRDLALAAALIAILLRLCCRDFVWT